MEARVSGRFVSVVLGVVLALGLGLDVPGRPGAVARASHPENVIFVDAGATGGEPDGSSWERAFPDLQLALAHAQSGDEIWVAKGIYRPAPGGERSISFRLKRGVAIYGGFAATETLRSQRSWAANVTVLSGDIDSNDTTEPNGVVADPSGIVGLNSYNVVEGSGMDRTAILDGVVVTAGRADGESSRAQGGGLFSVSGSFTLRNVIFSGNAALSGGAMHITGGRPLLVNVTFRNNATVTFAEGTGGALYSANSAPVLTDVTFSGNVAYDHGGGMFNDGSDPVLTNVTFSDNRSGSFGGGMYNSNSHPTLSGVTFRGNVASTSGGGMHNVGGSATLADATFDGNEANSFGGGMNNVESTVILSSVTFADNLGDDGGAIHNTSSTMTMTNFIFIANSGASGGGIDNYQSSTILMNGSFLGNSASMTGGGMNNVLSTVVLANVTFSGNWAGAGSGIDNLSSDSTITNVTFSYNNTAGGFSTALRNSGGTLRIANSILWGISGDQLDDQYSTSSVEYSIVRGGPPGPGNVYDDPLFVDADGADNVAGTVDDDLRLRSDSPAIDAGSNELVPADRLDLDGDGDVNEKLPLDLDERPRFVDHPAVADTGAGTAPIVDMGAFEAFVPIHRLHLPLILGGGAPG